MVEKKARYQNRIELLQGTLDLLILQTLQWGRNMVMESAWRSGIAPASCCRWIRVHFIRRCIG